MNFLIVVIALLVVFGFTSWFSFGGFIVGSLVALALVYGLKRLPGIREQREPRTTGEPDDIFVPPSEPTKAEHTKDEPSNSEIMKALEVIRERLDSIEEQIESQGKKIHKLKNEQSWSPLIWVIGWMVGWEISMRLSGLPSIIDTLFIVK